MSERNFIVGKTYILLDDYVLNNLIYRNYIFAKGTQLVYHSYDNDSEIELFYVKLKGWDNLKLGFKVNEIHYIGDVAVD